MKQPRIGFLLLALFGICAFVMTGADQALGFSSPAAQEPEDPLVLGAWLYQGNCTACHGPYEKERVGRGIAAEELAALVAGTARGGCSVDWSIRRGGPFSTGDLDAVVLYIQTWEELGREPDLPELPPQPTPTPSHTPTTAGAGALEPSPTSQPELDPQLRTAIDGSPLAMGAYLYTQNCYRCHQSYDFARVGMGQTVKYVQRTISDGKSGTSMQPFARKRGGDLSTREIRAIGEYIMAYEQLNEAPALPDILFVAPTPDPAKLIAPTLPAVAQVTGQAAAGEAVFAIHCAACHGASGQGASGPALSNRDWNSLRPDLTIRSLIRQGVPGSAMLGWGETAGGMLTEPQVNDLTALILQWSNSPAGAGGVNQTTPPGFPLLLLSGLGLAAVFVGRMRKNG